MIASNMANKNRLRIAGLVDESIADGPGLRLVVFTQGCLHGCKGCHNPQTHDPAGGYWLDIDEIRALYSRNPLLAGITFSGGEPFLQADTLAVLGRLVHELGGDVLTYTGYILENLLAYPLSANPGVSALLMETDILIDGPFIAEQASHDLDYRGSANQRILKKAGKNFVPVCSNMANL